MGHAAGYFPRDGGARVNRRGETISGVARVIRRGETISGVVVHVLDGDTIRIRTDSGDVVVQLNGVDAPDRGWKYGVESKAFVKEICMGVAVRVGVLGYDRYGRTVGNVRLPDGRDLANEIIRAGCGWWYVEYARGDVEKRSLMLEARAAGVGLWGFPPCVPPWKACRSH